MNKDILEKLKPWMKKPFELLFHAEIHYQKGTDYDKRLSLISFDNSIEVSITTYLTINPIQRGNRSYEGKKVDEWLKNYHTKIDFFISELTARGLPIYNGKDEIVWFHDQRNEQYHGSNAGVPSEETLNNIRQIAIWVFSVLFGISDVESLLQRAITEAEKSFPEIPQKFVTPKFDNIKPEHENSLFIASILGGWDENSTGDNKIIKELTSGF